MTSPLLPLVVEPEELEDQIDTDEIIIIDLSRAATYARNHIPGAIHLDYTRLVTSRPPVVGLLPDAKTLSNVLSSTGIRPESHVVAYDDEGGGKACRLLWTLDVIGHNHHSLLNGGLQAWINENHEVSNQTEDASPSEYNVVIGSEGIADKDYILAHLNDPAVTILDVRTPGEYDGSDKRSHRGGHIPGAINVEWARVLDPRRNLRLRPENELRSLYLLQEVMPDKEIIVYCQSHHRSAHSYIVLKSLDYPNVRGYPGSWSEWGNDPNTPLEQ